MWDRRVVRGNTYALRQLPPAAQPDPIELQRQAEARRRAAARRKAAEALRPRTPEALEGRKHMDVQTELYLEELCDRVEATDIDCQTDAFLDRPPTPLFVPAKTGIDIDTQIHAGDLFDFDMEVRPIVEVLIGKTMEQAAIEVMQEEELSALRSQQRAFEELRAAEAVERARLEEQERRHREEKERRINQHKEAASRARDTAARIAACAFAQSYLADLVPVVFGSLSIHGYFYDPVERDVEQAFMPWLLQSVEDQVKKELFGRRLLDSMLREVVLSRVHTRSQGGGSLPSQAAGKFSSKGLVGNGEEDAGAGAEEAMMSVPEPVLNEVEMDADPVTGQEHDAEPETIEPDPDAE